MGVPLGRDRLNGDHYAEHHRLPAMDCRNQAGAPEKSLAPELTPAAASSAIDREPQTPVTTTPGSVAPKNARGTESPSNPTSVTPTPANFWARPPPFDPPRRDALVAIMTPTMCYEHSAPSCCAPARARRVSSSGASTASDHGDKQKTERTKSTWSARKSPRRLENECGDSLGPLGLELSRRPRSSATCDITSELMAQTFVQGYPSRGGKRTNASQERTHCDAACSMMNVFAAPKYRLLFALALHGSLVKAINSDGQCR